MDIIFKQLRKKQFSTASSQAVLHAHADVQHKNIKMAVLPFLVLEEEDWWNSLKLKGSTVTSTRPGIKHQVKHGLELCTMIKGFKQHDQVYRFRPPNEDLNLIVHSHVNLSFRHHML